MSGIPTKLEKNGQHLLPKCHGEEARARSNGWLGLEEEGELIYRSHISIGWWLQPGTRALNLVPAGGSSQY